VHFLRNALDDVPRRVDDDCLRELRWLGACPRAALRAGPRDRRDLAEARRDLAAWLAKWQGTCPKLCFWVEEQIEETLTFYRLPRHRHKHPKSTNLIGAPERGDRARTHVVRIFPNAASRLPLIRALAVEMHENWLEAHRYLNMGDLREHKKEPVRMAA
jgi:transposase-like protein